MLKSLLVFAVLMVWPPSVWCEIVELPLERPFSNAMFDRPYIKGAFQNLRKIKHLPLSRSPETSLIVQVIKQVREGTPDLTKTTALLGSELYELSLREIEREYILKDLLRAVLIETDRYTSEQRTILSQHLQEAFPKFSLDAIERESGLNDFTAWFSILSSSNEEEAGFYRAWPMISAAFYGVANLLEIRTTFDLAQRRTLKQRLDEVLDLAIDRLMKRAHSAHLTEKTWRSGDYLPLMADHKLIEQIYRSFKRGLSSRAYDDLQRGLHVYIDHAPIAHPYGHEHKSRSRRQSAVQEARSLAAVKRAHILSCKRELERP